MHVRAPVRVKQLSRVGDVAQEALRVIRDDEPHLCGVEGEQGLNRQTKSRSLSPQDTPVLTLRGGGSRLEQKRGLPLACRGSDELQRRVNRSALHTHKPIAD